MAKLVRLSDELHDYIHSMSHDGESMGTAIKRLMDVEQIKGKIERQYSHREELIPKVVYTFSILEALVNANGRWNALRGEPEAKISSALMTEFRINRYMLLQERYPADEKIISGRARWQIRFATALRQLKKEKYIKREEGVGVDQGGRKSRREAYSITDLGKSVVNDYKLFIGRRHCYLTRCNDDARIPEPIPEEELPRGFRSKAAGQKARSVSQIRSERWDWNP